MLCFYLEFVPKVLKQMRMAIYIIGALVGIGITYTVLVSLFWCTPIHDNWSLDQTVCHSSASLRAMDSISAVHVTTDVFVWSLPFFIIRILKNLTFSQKAGACVMFALGFLCTTAAILSWVMNSVWVNGQPLSQNYRLTFAFFTIEQTTAIVVVCCPAMRVFCTKYVMGVVSRMKQQKEKGAESSGEDTGETSDREAPGAAGTAGLKQEAIINGSDVDLERNNSR